MTRYTTTVQGKHHEWRVTVAEESVADMRDDGIEVLEIVNTIPAWVVDAGFSRVWVFAQDFWDAPSRLWKKMRGK